MNTRTITLLSMLSLLALVSLVQAACNPACITNQGTCNSNDVCVCNNGFGGRQCEYPMTTVTTGTTLTGALNYNDGRLYKYKPSSTSSNPAGVRFQFKPTTQNVNCNSTSIRTALSYECTDGCVQDDNRYPSYSAYTGYSENMISPSFDMRQYKYSFSTNSLSSSCGCNNKSPKEATWYLWVQQKKQSELCEVQMDVFYDDMCFAHGSMVDSQTCSCSSGYGGEDFSHLCFYTLNQANINNFQQTWNIGTGRDQGRMFNFQFPDNLKNPGALDFTIEKVGGDCSQKSVYGRVMYKCDTSATGSCANEWSDKSYQYTLQSTNKGKLETEAAVLNVKGTASRSQCGCDVAPYDKDLRGNWGVFVYAQDSSSAPQASCQVKLTINSQDQCNNRGTYDADTRACKCDRDSNGFPMYGGAKCETPIQKGALDTDNTMTLKPTNVTYLYFPIPTDVQTDLAIVVSKTGGQCSKFRAAASMGCKTAGQFSCAAPYPHGGGGLANLDNSDFTRTWGHTTFDSNAGDCDCTKDNGDPTLFLQLSNIDGDADCEFKAHVTTTPYCYRNCNGQGECVKGTGCVCNGQFSGVYCTINNTAISTFVINAVPGKIPVAPGAQSHFWVNTSATNTELKLDFENTMASPVKVFGSLGHNMPTVSSTKTVNGLGDVIFSWKCDGCDFTQVVQNKKQGSIDIKDATKLAKGSINFVAVQDGKAAIVTSAFGLGSLQVNATFNDGFGSFVDIVFILLLLAAAGYYYYLIKKDPEKMKELIERVKNIAQSQIKIDEDQDRLTICQVPLRPEARYVVHTVDLLRYLQTFLARNYKKLPSELEIANRQEPVPVDVVLELLVQHTDNISDLNALEIKDFGLPPLPVSQLFLQVLDTIQRNVQEPPVVEFQEESTHASEIMNELTLSMSGLGRNLPPISMPVCSLSVALRQLLAMLESMDDQYIPTVLAESGAGSSSLIDDSSLEESLLGDKESRVKITALIQELQSLAADKLDSAATASLCLPVVQDKMDPTTFEAFFKAIVSALSLYPGYETLTIRSICATSASSSSSVAIPGDMLLSEHLHTVLDAILNHEFLPGILIRDSLILKTEEEKKKEEEDKKREEEEKKKGKKKEKEEDEEEDGGSDPSAAVEKAKGASAKAAGASASAGAAAGELGDEVSAELDNVDVDLDVDVSVDVDINLIDKPKIDMNTKYKLMAIAVGLQIVSFFFDLLRSLFNVGVIHGASKNVFPIPGSFQLKVAVTSVLGGLGDITHFFANTFGNLNFLPLILNWNCKGAFLFMSAVVMLVGTRFFIKLLQQDWLLKVAIRMEEIKARETNQQKQKMVEKLASMIDQFAYAGMQMFVIFLFSMLTASLNPQFSESCSGIDAFSKSFAQIIMVGGLFIGLAANFFLFAGKTTNTFERFKGNQYLRFAAIIGHGFWRITKMTFGYWDDEMVKSHRIVGRAHELLDFNDDGDLSRHESLISVTGKSRGLFWYLIPGTAVLAKTSETLSDPTPWDRSESLKFKNPFKVRAFKWANNVAKLGSVVFTALAPSTGSVVVLFLATFPAQIYNLYSEITKVQAM